MQVDQLNHLIRNVVISSRVVTTIAGTLGVSGSADGVGTASSFNYPWGVAVNPLGTIALIVSTCMMYMITVMLY